jgi:hypothetical protein
MLLLLFSCTQYGPAGQTSCPNTAVIETELRVTRSDGATSVLSQEEGTSPDAPAFWGTEGPETGNIAVSEGLGFDYLVLGLHGGDQGAGPGAMCRDFDHNEFSQGCDWFEFGTGEITADDGELIYDTLEWDTESATLCVTDVQFGDAGSTFSFTLDGTLSRPDGMTVTVEGAVLDAYAEY